MGAPCTCKWTSSETGNVKTGLVKLLCWVIFTAFATRAANILSQWQRTRRAASEQAKLHADQRKLMGLPPSVQKTEAPSLKQRKLPAGSGKLMGTPLLPPVRFPAAISTPESAGGLLADSKRSE